MTKSGKVGLPDESDQVVQGQMQTLLDVGELAARLGSIDTYQRSGNVAYLDDFTLGMGQWSTVTVGGSSSVSIVTSPTASKSEAMQLQAGTASNSYAIARHYFTLPASKYLGIEWWWCFVQNASSHMLRVDRYLADALYEFDLNFSFQGDVLQLYDHDAGWVTIRDPMSLPKDGFTFNKCKLIIDIDEPKWNRLFVNETYILLTDYTAKHTVTSGTPYCRVLLEAYNTPGDLAKVVIDNFILTVNEEITSC